jgi:hypothetical protein
MTPEAKQALSKTIRGTKGTPSGSENQGLRQRLLADLHDATESTYRLSVKRAQDSGLDEAGLRKRKRLEAWIDEQWRAEGGVAGRRSREDFRREAEQQAAYTLLNRLVILRLMEAPGDQGTPIRPTELVSNAWESRAYKDLRELAPGLVRGDATEGYAFLLQLVFEELATDLPGLFGSAGIADLIPIPPATLRYAIEALAKPELESCWGDDMTLGWVYQYWNDPERERLDDKLNAGDKIEPYEIASKTQMFTERYMVDWMLHNSLGLMWFTLCKKQGWTPEVQTNGTLQRLEERRVEWRSKRASGEVSLTALMPLETEEEKRWVYFLPDQVIPEEAVDLAPGSIREWKILDPAVGSGHFLVVAMGLLLALFQEEARQRGEQNDPKWTDQAIVEHILAHTLHGIDIDPRAVQIAAASLWLKAKGLCTTMQPAQLNLVAPNLRLAELPEDDPALVELRRDIEVETGISAEFTHQILQALQGADHLGSLLKIDQAVDAAIEQQERRLRALSAKAQQVQPDLFGGAPPVQAKMDFSAAEARTDLQELLEQFLTRHSSANDLGLRLHGEQLAAGVRFVRILKEGTYDLIAANPPYQGTSKMASSSYVERHYPLGKADLYAAFLLRGLELAKPGGLSAMLTMRNWMFLKQYSGLRENLLSFFSLRLIHDLSSGAFEEISAAQVVVSVASSIFQRLIDASNQSMALKVFDDETVTSIGETLRKRTATLAQESLQRFQATDFKIVPEWPLVYWWDKSLQALYASTPLVGAVAPAAKGICTSDDERFLLRPWESHFESSKPNILSSTWQPSIHGAKDEIWIEPMRLILRWSRNGLENKVMHEAQWGSHSKRVQNQHLYFQRGVAFSMIGGSFSARVHRFPSIFGDKGSSIFPHDFASAVCAMNSTRARKILESLNPSISFQVGDVNRLPLFTIAGAKQIYLELERAFTKHESHREPSVEFLHPGPSSWRHAQEWAQQAVDRPEGAPLPEYTEELDPEPPSDHLSFALGVAFGRFAPVNEDGRRTTSNPDGILDPINADLSHALPAGILFLDGSLAETDLRDGLGHPAAQQLHQAWARYGPAIATNRNLRDWLRLDFFKDVHKGMYENRPIHWPLSSASKTFVAWVNIHRMDGQTLRLLLADHLIDGSLKRIEGEIDDLRSSVEGGDAKAARLATKRLNYLLQARDELKSFIAAVQECADQGPPPPDARCKQRAVDAPFDPDLDDGVMINSASLWPLLDPQWKDPKKWWKELATAAGRKDYDWAHLAMRYWPDRVDQKCQNDPSLGVAHGCFWRYHPACACAWELRLQEEISSDFRIEEAPYRPGGRELGDAGDGPHRAAWLADHPEEALAAVEKEAIRRMGRGNNRKLVGEMTILEPGLWSALPRQVWDMELRLGERQGSEFCLIAPDEAEAREQLLAAHPHLATDRRAFLQGLAPQGELAVVLEDDETQEELEEIE